MDPNDPSQSTPIVPNIDPNIGDIQEMDLGAITGAYDDIGQSFNQMGQNSVADIANRQQQLIGNNFGSPLEGPMGNYNESTYIEPVVTSAQSTIKQVGTQVALNEGIRRSEEAAEEKLKETQKKYNEWVAEQNRKAAEAAQKAANSARNTPGGWSSVNENSISQETLEKHNLSLEDFAALDQDARTNLLREDYERRTGFAWDYKGEDWYATVDRLYKEFGVSGDAAKDERTGNQTEANKAFWKRADVSKRFGEVHAEVQGFTNGAQVMKERTEYVRKANTAIETWLNPRTPEEKALSFDKIMQAIEITMPVKQDTTEQKNLTARAQIEERLKLHEENSQNSLSDDEKRELSRLAEGHRAGKAFQDKRLNELLDKAGDHTKLQEVQQGFFEGMFKPSKFEVKTGTKIVNEKVSVSNIIESALGLTPQELRGMRAIKDKDAKEFERILKVSNRVIANNYITVSDGTDKADNYFRNEKGELELAGVNEVIIHYMPSAKNDPALEDLRKYLKDPLYMEAVQRAGSNPEGASEEDKQKLKRFEETAGRFRQNQLMVAAVSEGRGYTDTKDIYSAVLYDAGSDNDTARGEIAGRQIRDWLNEFRDLARNDKDEMSERYLDLLDKANAKQGGYVNVDGSWTPLDSDTDPGRSSIGAPRKHYQDLSNEQAMALFMIIKKEQDAGEFSNNFLDKHDGADSGAGDKIWHSIRSTPNLFMAGAGFLGSGIVSMFSDVDQTASDEFMKYNWDAVSNPARYEAGGAQRHDQHAYDTFRKILDVQYTADTGEEGWYGKDSDFWTGAKRFGGDLAGFGADLGGGLIAGGISKSIAVNVARRTSLKIASTYGEQLGKNVAKTAAGESVLKNAEGAAGIRIANGQIKTFEEIGSDLATAAMNGRSATNYLKEISPEAFKGLTEKQMIKAFDDSLPKGLRGVQARHRIWQANLRQSNADIAGYTSLMMAGVSSKAIAQASPQALRAAVQVIKEGGKDGGSVFSAASRRQIVADAEKKIAKLSDEIARGIDDTGKALTESELRAMRNSIATQRRRIANPGSPALAREYGFQSAATVARKLVERGAQVGASGSRMSKYDVARFLAREGSDSARKEAFIKRFMRDEGVGNALFAWGDQRNSIDLETGEHRWEDPAYLAEAIITGTALGAGIHLAGGPTQSIKRQLVNDRIQKLKNSLVKNGIDPKNKAHVRKMNEISRLTRYADRLMDDAMMHAGNPDQVALFKKTAEEAKQASRAVLNSLQEVKGFADSSVGKSVDDLLEAISGRAGYETRLMRTMTTLRGESHTDWVRRTSTMRNLASIDSPEVNARIMKSGFDSLAAARSAAKKELSPNKANEAMDKGLVDGLVAHGVNRKVAEQEIKALRREYDDKWNMLEAKAKEGVISLDSFGGRKRGGYLSPAGMTHTMVDDLGEAEWGLIFERKVNADVAKPTIERQADMGKVISNWLDGKPASGKGHMKVRNPQGMNLVTSLQTYSNMVNSEIYLRTLDENIIRNGDVIVVGKTNLDKAIADDLAAAKKDLDDYMESLTKDGTKLLPQGAIRMGAGDPVSIAAKKVADVQAKLDGANGIELSPVAIQKAAKALRRSTEEFSAVYKAVSKIFEDNKNNILKGEEGFPNLARYTDDSGNYTREGVLEATFRAVYKRNPAWKAEGADSITGGAKSQYFKGMNDNQQTILAKRVGDDSNLHTRELINEARRHFAEVDGGEGIFGVGDVVQYVAERTPLSTNAKRDLDSVGWIPLSNRLTRQGADDTIADMALDNSLDPNTKLLAEALGVDRNNSARLRTFENADAEYISAMANDVSKHKGLAKPDGEEIEWEEMADIISSHRKRFGEYVNDVQFKRPGEMDDGVLGTYSYTNDLITISLGASKGTYDHESVHRAIGQFLTADEINTLYRSITVAAGGKKKLRELYQTPDGYTGGWKSYAEEHLGNVFAEYMKGNVHLRNISKRNQKMQEWAMSKGLPLELVQIIGKLVDRIEGFVHGSLKSRSESRQYVIDFFDKLESGGFANAKPTPTVASEVRTLARTRLKDAASGAVDSVRFEMEHAMKLFGLAANSMTPIRRRAAREDVRQDRGLDLSNNPSLQAELDQITGGAYVSSLDYDVDALMRFKELPTAEKQAALDDLSGRLEAMHPEKGPDDHTAATNKHQRNLREIVADNNLRDPDFDESPMFTRITDPELPNRAPEINGGYSPADLDFYREASKRDLAVVRKEIEDEIEKLNKRADEIHAMDASKVSRVEEDDLYEEMQGIGSALADYRRELDVLDNPPGPRTDEPVDLGTMKVNGRDVPVPALTENGVIMPGVKAPEIYIPRDDRAKKGETLDTPGYEVGLKGYAERTSKKINDKLTSILGSKKANNLAINIDDALSLGQMPADGTPFSLSLQLFYDRLAGALRAGDITPAQHGKAVDDTYQIVMGRPRRSSSDATEEGTTGAVETDELRELRQELNEFKPVGKEDGPIDLNASSSGALLESEFKEMRDAINYNQEYGRPLTNEQRKAMAAHNEVINNPNSTDEQVKEATEKIHKLLKVRPSGDDLYEPTKLSYSEYSEIAGDPLARFYADITDEELTPAVNTLKAELKAAEKELADAKAAKKDEVSSSLGPIRNVNDNEVADKVAELSERVARIEAAKGSGAYVNRNGMKFIGETNNLQGYSAATTLTEVEEAKRTTQEGFHPIENRTIRKDNKRKGAVSRASVQKRQQAYDEITELVKSERGAGSAINDSDIMIHQGLARVKSMEQKQFSSTQGFQKAALATAGFAKAIQNVQLSAGYSRYNAYSFRYLISAMMSNPLDAVPLLKTLRESRSIESVNKFYMENQGLFMDVAQKTGDPFYIEMYTNSVSQRAAFDSGYLYRGLRVGSGNARWREHMDLNDRSRRKELADEGNLDTWRNAPKYDSTTAVAVKSGAARRTAKTVANFVEATWDEPTFKRFMPVLSGTLFLQNYKRAIELAKNRQLKRVTAEAKKNGGEVNPADLMLSQADIDNAIMMAHVRTKIFFHPAAAKGMSIKGLKTLMGEGSYDNAAIDRFITKLTKDQVKEITDANQGMNAGKIIGSLFFAMQYKATQLGQIANGIAGVGQLGNAAARGTNASFTQQGSRNLAFSMLALTAAAMVFNEINGRTQAWDDPERLLTNLNEIGKFRLGDGDGTPAIDPFFSQFTLLNSLFRGAVGLAGVEGGTGVGKSNPHRGIGLPGTSLYVRGFSLGPIQDEITSNLLSPFKAVAEVVTNNTYFGGNIWEHATKLDGTPNANYDPGRNLMAGVWHLLGLDTTNRYVKGDNPENDKTSWVGGSGLIQHPYIDTIKGIQEGEYGQALFTALEIPIKWDNLPGRAKSSLNGYVVDTIGELKQDYDAVVKANPGDKAKIDAAYESFTKQAVDVVADWSAKNENVLEQNPKLIAAAQRVLTGFFADHYDDNLMKMQGAYWKASIESGLGADFGWEPLPGESEDDMAKRIDKVNQYFFAERDKERDARDELKRLGFDVGDRWGSSDEYDKYRNVHRNVIAQFEKATKGRINGFENLKASKKNYEDRIKLVDEIYTNKAKARAKKTELAEEHNQSVFDLLAPYVEEYGPYTLEMYDRSGGRGLGDMAAELLIIPADVLWKYGTNRNPEKNYLKDYFGVGWSNNSNLPSDAAFQKSFDKMTARINRGEIASASKILDDIIKNVQHGKYGVTGKDWARTLRYREIINGRIGV